MGEYNLGPEKMISGIKSDFLKKFWSIPEGKYRIAMTRSFLERSNFVTSYL